MGKAEELMDDLLRHPLTPEEIATRYPKVPELRLRADAPTVEVDATTTARDVLERVQSQDVGSVALRDSTTGVTAVVMPVERYLELVGGELAHDPLNKEAGLNGTITPTEAALVASHVEQINPHDTWFQAPRTVA
jgi:hypothetical protein